MNTPPVLDGRLDDEVYHLIPPVGDFVQQEPREGEPATERTDVWVFFDRNNLYVGARCWDSQPTREIANDMRRDGNLSQQDNLVVTFDTFHDARSGFYFQTSPVGALRDGLVNDERNANMDWNGIWDAKVSRDDMGWTLEMVVPFKTLRYESRGQQVWGVNFRRTVRWKNETSFLSLVPASYGNRGSFKMSSSATLVGLDMPAQSRNLELKPYGRSGVSTDRQAAPAISNQLRGAVGGDAKVGLTKGLVADVTVNTDFAQVEADDQQVNLSRVSVLFPEKRDFFLEGQGIFLFGGAQQRGGGGAGGGAQNNELMDANQAPSLIPILFFSRQIGLKDGREVPIRAGGRVTGRAGRYSIGALEIETGDAEEANVLATNFSVIRVKRDLFRRSSVGFIGTNRSPRIAGAGSSQVAGVDANFVFLQNMTLVGYYARSRNPNATSDEASYLTRFDYAGDRYGLNVEHLSVGDGFTPEIGFVPRPSFRRTYGYARFSPRTPSSETVRKLSWESHLDYIADRSGQLQSREATGSFRIDLNNGDQLQTEYNRNEEVLRTPFPVATGVAIAPGSYAFQEVNATYFLAPQRPLSGRLNVSRGSFYNGDRTVVGLSGRFDLGPRFGIEPRISSNWVTMPGQSATVSVISARATFTATPRMALTSLVQYSSNTSSLTSNVRFRWEYVPGSEFFLVYSDGRSTSLDAFPRIGNHSIVAKVTRLLRF